MRCSASLRTAQLFLILLLTVGFAGFAAASERTDVCEPDPTCEEACRHKAQEAGRACRESGRPAWECRRLVRMLLDACVFSECRPTPSCEERCKLHAKRLVQRCLEAGEDVNRCRDDARMALHRCIERNCQGCACPRVYEPVCGSDSKTYSNACEADCAGVKIHHSGPCEPRCRPLLCDVFCEFGHKKDRHGCPTCECNPHPGCQSDDQCRDDQVCRKICPAAPCHLDLETGDFHCPPCVGVCRPKPDEPVDLEAFRPRQKSGTRR